MTSEEEWPEVTLYHGDNGVHEFWETAGMRPGPGGLVLMQSWRPGGEREALGWTAEVRRIGLRNEWYSEATLEELVRMVARLLGWRIVLSDSAQWQEPYNDRGSVQVMNLVALDPAVVRPYQPLDL